MTEPKIATWWTPSGWVRSAQPAPYAATWDEEESSILADIYAKHGYRCVVNRNDACSGDLCIIIHSYTRDDGTPRHLIVDIDDNNECFSTIFVAAEHIDAFWFDKYPALLVQLRQCDATWEQTKMTKAFIAFVRHGHGDSVIDQDATYDRDDRTRDMAAAARRRDAAAKS